MAQNNIDFENFAQQRILEADQIEKINSTTKTNLEIPNHEDCSNHFREHVRERERQKSKPPKNAIIRFFICPVLLAIFMIAFSVTHIVRKGFFVKNNDRNNCICNNGKPEIGKVCHQSGMQICSECDYGYSLDYETKICYLD